MKKNVGIKCFMMLWFFLVNTSFLSIHLLHLHCESVIFLLAITLFFALKFQMFLSIHHYTNKTKLSMPIKKWGRWCSNIGCY